MFMFFIYLLKPEESFTEHRDLLTPEVNLQVSRKEREANPYFCTAVRNYFHNKILNTIVSVTFLIYCAQSSFLLIINNLDIQ